MVYQRARQIEWKFKTFAEDAIKKMYSSRNSEIIGMYKIEADEFYIFKQRGVVKRGIHVPSAYTLVRAYQVGLSNAKPSANNVKIEIDIDTCNAEQLFGFLLSGKCDALEIADFKEGA